MAADEEGKLVSSGGGETGSSGAKGLSEAAGKALGPAAEVFGREVVPFGQEAGQLTNRVGLLLIRALAPLVYGLEKSADWIEKAVTERLKDVPKDKVVLPNPRIAVPALQALTYSLDDELIREMFANLLAADMNDDRKKDAHPAFVELIKEMTPTDARVLKLVRDKPAQCSFTVRIGSASRFFGRETHYSFSIEGLSDNEIGTSLNNLERLGLLELRDEFPISQEYDDTEARLKTEYEERRQSFDTPEIRQILLIAENGRVEVSINRKGIGLNLLGASFVRICLS
jgi:hypothetical protein